MNKTHIYIHNKNINTKIKIKHTKGPLGNHIRRALGQHSDDNQKTHIKIDRLVDKTVK